MSILPQISQCHGDIQIRTLNNMTGKIELRLIIYRFKQALNVNMQAGRGVLIITIHYNNMQ